MKGYILRIRVFQGRSDLEEVSYAKRSKTRQSLCKLAVSPVHVPFKMVDELVHATLRYFASTCNAQERKNAVIALNCSVLRSKQLVCSGDSRSRTDDLLHAMQAL